MTRMLAPILAFTSEEIWAAMPHSQGDDASCVLLNDIPDYDESLRLPEEKAAQWDAVIALRDDVNKALEQARCPEDRGQGPGCGSDAVSGRRGPEELRRHGRP